MPNGPYILAIDQGTTSTRAVAFSIDGTPVAAAQETFRQIYPQDGWVEHDPEEIWQTVRSTALAVIEQVGGTDAVTAIGITNQRETTVLWDRHTGQPVANAIVWQDRRGAEECRALVQAGIGTVIQEKTGLIPDSYFSATKIKWILDSDPSLRSKARNGALAFGTIDTFLLWRLTGGSVHATDATNASRTLLFNIHEQQWDEFLLDCLDVPSGLLPEVRDTACAYANTEPSLFGAAIPITALVGDQQGALAGQTCSVPGTAKSTFGTGAFVLLNTGDYAPLSKHNLLTTVAFRFSGKPTYAYEGSVFNAGTVVQWMRDEMDLFTDASHSESMAQAASDSDVVFVPAFTGLGAPHWDPAARGAILGLTRDSSRHDVVRAGLESVCFQIVELLDCMASDTGQRLETLRVDGGMATNNWMLQTLANITGLPVERPQYLETTVQGAAFLAGLGHGIYDSFEDVAQVRKIDRVFEPNASQDWRESRYALWEAAVKTVKNL